MTENREDIFDKIMRLPLLRIFEPFYKKHQEILLYLFFGGVVTVVSIGTFQLFYAVFKIVHFHFELFGKVVFCTPHCKFCNLQR